MRTAPSHEAEATLSPAGETASPAIGALCASNTCAGTLAPARQTARRPSSPPVTKRPSGSAASALTAPSWKRSTCKAAPRSRSQRIADWSKLPDIAVLPSGDTASARTGPPWPRSCASAGSARTSGISAAIRASIFEASILRASIGCPRRIGRPAGSRGPAGRPAPCHQRELRERPPRPAGCGAPRPARNRNAPRRSE